MGLIYFKPCNLDGKHFCKEKCLPILSKRLIFLYEIDVILFFFVILHYFT